MTTHGPSGFRLTLGRALLVIAVAATGCAADARPVPVDRGLDFAAHEVHAGLVIDRTREGGTGMVTPVGGPHLEPRYLLSTWQPDDEQIRVTGPGSVVVERAAGTGRPREVGRVEPSWDNWAIRLRIEPAGGTPIESGLFRRVDSGAGGSVLTRLDETRLDLKGTYQARLRTPDGRDVGWLGLIVGESQPGHVMYEGVLPRGLDDAMAAAAVEALGSEIAYIETTSRGVSRAPEWR